MFYLKHLPLILISLLLFACFADNQKTGRQSKQPPASGRAAQIEKQDQAQPASSADEQTSRQNNQPPAADNARKAGQGKTRPLVVIDDLQEVKQDQAQSADSADGFSVGQSPQKPAPISGAGQKADKQTGLAVYGIADKGPAGGLVFYDKGFYSHGWRYLETAPEDLERQKWGAYGESVSGADGSAVGDGKQNTADIAAAYPDSDYAANAAIDYRAKGYGDWYLPSIDELREMHAVLHRRGLGDFRSEYYWSSTESSGNLAFRVNFGNGETDRRSKSSTNRARLIRRF